MMTTIDKIKAAIGTITAALVTFGVLDVGQSDAISGLFVAAITLYLALSVKPLGPAS